MAFPILSTHDIKTLIKSLFNKNGGVQDIAVYVVKIISDLLYLPLTILLNQYIGTRIFPAMLKIARFTLNLKSGFDNDPPKCRPISLLSVLSKILETLMKNSSMQYLENINIFNVA